MANIAIFEDLPITVELARIILEEADHTIIGTASNMPEAYKLLAELALGEKRADYTLLDGSLKRHPPQEYFRLAIMPEVVVPPESDLNTGADGRQIAKIINAFGINTTLINISGYNSHNWALGLNRQDLLDNDLTKHEIFAGLVPMIAELQLQSPTQH